MSFGSVTVSTVCVSVVVEEEEADNVGGQTETTDDQDELGLGDFLGLNEALDSFKRNRDTEGDKENTVDKGSQSFGALPLGLISLLSYVVYTTVCPSAYHHIPHKCTSWSLFSDAPP